MLMPPTLDQWIAHLLARVNEVRANLGMHDSEENCKVRFAEVLDSMGMVEFVSYLAEDCRVSIEVIEGSVDHRFGTVLELAQALQGAGLQPQAKAPAAPLPAPPPPAQPRVPEPAVLPSARGFSAKARPAGWLTGISAGLPEAVQPAAAINTALGRPPGWLERHAGIRQRRIWAEQDPLAAASLAAHDAVARAGLSLNEVGALLVTSEAPPLLAGTAAALLDRLGLKAGTPALEIGGACTGFLAALWTAKSLLPTVGPVLVVSIEATTRYLHVQPGPAGEAAALFGDGTAAVLVCARPCGPESLSLGQVILRANGQAGRLLRLERNGTGTELHMKGVELAEMAVHVMAQSVQELLQQYELVLSDLVAVVAHGGNGRLPALLARLLGLPVDRVLSETPRAGNLGSASLPVAYALHEAKRNGPTVWTAVGAGLMWGGVMIGFHAPSSQLGAG
jgi:3-oxoacyl-[acyl-carrier-protein] synthase-3